MNTRNSDEALGRILAQELTWVSEIAQTPLAWNLRVTRKKLLDYLHKVGQSGDLDLIVRTEKAIVQGDLDHYTNSREMLSSLRNALFELETAQAHMGIVSDPAEYRRIDRAHRLPKHRKAGLPMDEARQVFSSHYARLGNLDKSRLDDEEKEIIDARKANIGIAEKCYAQAQARALEQPPG